MQSRMNKYYDNVDDIEEVVPSRAQRNKNLYREVSNLEIEEFDLNSNASVIGDNTDNINIDDIKEILNEKYAEDRKNKSFGDSDIVDTDEIHLDETREYDINSLISKAKESKEVDYEKERLKKLRDTQYDIFKDIEEFQRLDEDDEEERKISKTKSRDNEKELLELINTITAKELISEQDIEESGIDLDPLDILTDLKGDNENTKVMGALVLDEEEQEDETVKQDTLETILKDINVNKEETEEETIEKADDKKEEVIDEDDEKIKETKNFSTNELGDIMNTRTLEIEKTDTGKIDKSFITNTTSFTQSDFDDFNDLKEDMKATKVVIRILVVLIILVFIAGCVILLNKFLGLGLF